MGCDQAKRRYFDVLAGEWDSLPRPPEAEEKLREFCRLAVMPGARYVLDCGCGTGLLVPYLRSQLGESAWLVELDFARGMLVEGKRKYSSQVAWVCSDVRRLPFAAQWFDAVLMFGLLPHVEEQAQALKEAWRVLRLGGRLAVGHLMSSGELNAFHSQLEGPVREDRLMPAAELARLLGQQLGAELVEAREEPGLYRVCVRKPPR